MARKNRVVVPGGTYHVTSRIAGRAHLLEDPTFKDDIVEWMHGIARFSGVELLAWCVMDNHFHMLVHVPEVPEEYRLVPSESPDAYAFGMRPAECNPPIWSSGGDSPLVQDGGASGGDSPLNRTRVLDNQAGACPRLARPPTGFTLPDEEMLLRLCALYGAKRAEAFRRRWERMRSNGRDAEVEAEKEPYCRRMYSLSPFVKTFKERIAYHVNSRLGRTGHVFEGRFHSGLVEDGRGRSLTSLYIDNNPVRAGMADDPAGYRWCSYAAARDGKHSESCRRGYAKTFGCEWPKAGEIMREAFLARLPPDAERNLRKGSLRLTPAQLIHVRVAELSYGAYIAGSIDFAARSLGRLAKGFPAASARSLRKLVAMVDWEAA